MRQLRSDPVRRLWGYYRTSAVWGGVLLGAVLIENLPIWAGRLWLLPFVPPIAGRRAGHAVGLFVGIAAGFLHDWTADGWFGIAGAVLGILGFLCGGNSRRNEEGRNTR